MEGVAVTDYNTWIEEAKPQLQPPVCNKLMYGGELKIMAVGGPNVRSDYHLEEGEELFYQIKGDMVLKIIEKNHPKDVVIKEGEIFLLPPRIPHSPQRKADTIGLVVERERRETEIDGMRWFVTGTAQVLYEEYFHCTDLVVQLPPVIRRFQASPMYVTGIPDPGGMGTVKEPPVTVDDKIQTVPPKSIEEFLKEKREELAGGSAVICDGKDFTVTMFGANSAIDSAQHSSETYYYQMKGSARLSTEKGEATLQAGHMVLVQPDLVHSVKFGEDAVAMKLVWYNK